MNRLSIILVVVLGVAGPGAVAAGVAFTPSHCSSGRSSGR